MLLQVPGNDSITTRFPIVPHKLGNIPIQVTALSSTDSDIVLRMLLVEVHILLEFIS